MHPIKFGMWSTILLLISLHGLVMAALLLRSRRNVLANRFLAALLCAVILFITPYTIGYAGVYDAWPQLTYWPFFWQWSFAPLLYFHVRQLGSDALPRHWRWHFLPAALQGAYYLVIMWWPLESKWAWAEAVHDPWLAPLQSLGFHLSMAVYWPLAYRRHRAYQAWLRDNSAQREELRLAGLHGFLLAVAAVAVAQAGFDLGDRFIAPLDYFDRFGLYLGFALLVYYLGLEGWRNAERVYPPMSPTAVGPAQASAVAGPSGVSIDAGAPAASTPAARDWHALAQRWATTVADAGWWREPDLGLTDLARRLGTNTQYLSRALNEGLGQSFSEFVNRQRIAAAQHELAGDDDILVIALRVGFGSKASFNRAFRQYAGCTPSQFRETLDRTRRKP